MSFGDASGVRGNPVWLPPLVMFEGAQASGQILGLNLAINQVYLFPFWIFNNMTISQIQIGPTAGTWKSLGLTLRFGFYQDNGNKPDGGKLLYDTGPFVGGTGVIFTLPKLARLKAGIVWLAFEVNLNAGSVAALDVNTGVSGYSLQDASGEFLTQLVTYSNPTLPGGLPTAMQDPCPATTVQSGVHSAFYSWLRIYSIP